MARLLLMGHWAIKWASQNGYHEVVTFLPSDARVNPSADDNEAIKLASQNGHHDVVDLLLTDPRITDPRDLSIIESIFIKKYLKVAFL